MKCNRPFTICNLFVTFFIVFWDCAKQRNFSLFFVKFCASLFFNNLGVGSVFYTKNGDYFCVNLFFNKLVVNLITMFELYSIKVLTL